MKPAMRLCTWTLSQLKSTNTTGCAWAAGAGALREKPAKRKVRRKIARRNGAAVTGTFVNATVVNVTAVDATVGKHLPDVATDNDELRKPLVSQARKSRRLLFVCGGAVAACSCLPPFLRGFGTRAENKKDPRQTRALGRPHAGPVYRWKHHSRIHLTRFRD